MKTCPNCAAANRADAVVCYNCGLDLSARPSAPLAGDSTGATQPVRRRPPAPGYGPSIPPGGPYPPPSGYPPYDPSAPTGTAPQGAYRPGGASPDAPAAGYSPYAPPGDPYFPPPPPPYAPPRQPRTPGRFWTALILWLALALLCGGGLALWTLASATYGGIYGVGVEVATQVGQVFEPTAPPPTATPQPTPTPQGALEPTPNATQESAIRKLLSPECSGALDRLSAARDQLTQNPAAPFDAAWREELNQAIEQTRAFCGSLESASPVPGIVAQAQRDLAQAQAEFDEANRLFKEGVDELNPGKIFEAGGRVVSAGKYLDAAVRELRRIGQ